MAKPKERRTTSPIRLLIVDDEVIEARLLKANLDRAAKARSELATSAEEALERLSRETFDAVATDLVMPGIDGIQLVRRIRETDPSLPVFVFTAFASVEKAVEGIRAGATDFLPKPVNTDALLALIERAIGERSLREELTAKMDRRDAATLEDYLVGEHPRLDEVRRFAETIAAIPSARVLITGESGTGKSLLARAIHDHSGSSGRFIEVNCAALPAGLLESELFGHERGAFTDARAIKRGLIELAHDGTLLLDEIGAMPLELQAKLLHFLERQEIRRVGGSNSISLTLRIVAATNEDLAQRVRERAFRQDVLYRLDVASIEMPPLRDMPSVIPELALRFVRELAAEFHKPVPEISESSFAALLSHTWPGNVRELRNTVERALIFHERGPLVVKPRPAAEDHRRQDDGILLEHGLTVAEVERRYMEATLARERDQPLDEVARRLGISRKTLWAKRREFGM